MKFFSQTSIKSKLIGGFLLCAFLTSLSVVFGVMSTRSIQKALGSTTEKVSDSIAHQSEKTQFTANLRTLIFKISTADQREKLYDLESVLIDLNEKAFDSDLIQDLIIAARKVYRAKLDQLENSNYLNLLKGSYEKALEHILAEAMNIEDRLVFDLLFPFEVHHQASGQNTDKASGLSSIETFDSHRFIDGINDVRNAIQIHSALNELNAFIKNLMLEEDAAIVEHSKTVVEASLGRIWADVESHLRYLQSEKIRDLMIRMKEIIGWIMDTKIRIINDELRLKSFMQYEEKYPLNGEKSNLSIPTILDGLDGINISEAGMLKMATENAFYRSRDVVSRWYRSLTLLGVAAVSIAILVGVFVSRSIIRPVQKAAEAADTIRSGNLSVRLNLGLQDEIGELAGAMDAMAESLEKEIDTRKQTEEMLREGERQIRLLLDSTAEAIFGIDVKGTCTFVNNSCLKLLRYESAEDLIGKNMHEMIHHTRSDGRPLPVEDCRICGAFRSGEATHSTDEIMWRSDETSFNTEYWAHPFIMNEQVVGAVVTFLDITDRKESERRMMQEKVLTDTLINSVPSSFWMFNAQGRLIRWNKRFEEYSGYTGEELSKLQPYVMDLIPEADRTAAEKAWQEVMQAGKVDFEAYGLRKDGSVIPFFFTAARVVIDDQTYVLGTGIDITERKLAEESLHKYVQIVSATSDLMSLVDRNYVYQAVNQAYLTAHSKNYEEIVGHSIADLHGEELFNNVIKKEVDRCLAGEEISFQAWFEYTGLGWRFMDVIYNSYTDEEGSISGVVVNARDITDQKMAQDAQRESEERFRELADNIREVFWLFDCKEQRVLYVSPAYEEVWGRSISNLYENYQEWGDSIHPDDVRYAEESFQKILETGGGEDREYRIVRPDGLVRWVLDRGFAVKGEDGEVIRIAGIAEDITQRKKVEDDLKASEKFLQDVFDGIQDGISVLDTELRIVRVNHWMEESYRGSGPLIGKKCHEVYQGRGDICPWCPSVNTIKSGKTHTEIVPYPSSDNLEGWLELTSFPLKDIDGAIIGVIEHVKNITERKRMEADKERLTAILESTTDLVSIATPDGRLEYMNSAGRELLNWDSREDITQRNIPDAHPTWASNLVLNEGLPTARDKSVWRGETAVIGESGEEIPVSQVIMAHQSPSGKIEYFSTIMRDISERKKAEEVLRDVNEKLQAMIKASPVAIVLLDKDGNVILWSPAAKKIFGWREDEVIGRPNPVVSKDKEAEFELNMKRVLRGESISDLEMIRMKKDGTPIHIGLSVAPLLNAEGETYGVAGMMTDITERKHAEQALRESEERYRSLFDLSPDAILIFQGEEIIQANSAAMRFLGATSLDQIVGLTYREIVPPEYYAQRETRYQTVIKAGGTLPPIEYQFIRLDGQRIYVEATTTLIPYRNQPIALSVCRDITESKRTEEELREYREHLEELIEQRTEELAIAQEGLLKQERLAVLGQLTATVSHELRNPLGVIRSSSFYLKRKHTGQDDKIKKHLNRIEDQVDICDTIVGDLLEFTRGRHSQKIEREINPWLEQVLNEIQMPKGVKVVSKLAQDFLMVSMDSGKMRRVMINLVNNAIQALSDRQEQSKKADISYHAQVKISTIKREDAVQITVEDNGIGMDEHTARRAFEPLFTTRARGTGLGLAIVQKIVEEHGGSVSLNSKLHRGTKVTVEMPVGVGEKH